MNKTTPKIGEIPKMVREEHEVKALFLKEYTGSIQKSGYIAIVGSRGAGKTCYLVSLCREVSYSEDEQETQKFLTPMYMDLCQGNLPRPTAHRIYEYHFHINTEIEDQKRTFHITTKDYSGEMLQGRMDDISEDQMREEKSKEIYDFFSQARGILILLETIDHALPLEQQMNYENELESIINTISQYTDGSNTIQIPIAIVLSKWDRQIQKYADTARDVEIEEKCALQYLENSPWSRIYQKITMICPLTKVFPIYSFWGDKPNVQEREIQSFNLTAPWIWIAQHAEICLFQKAKLFQQEYPKDYAQILANYQSLFTVDKVQSPSIVLEIQEIRKKISQEYYDTIMNLPKREKMLALKKFIQTPFLYEEIKQKAEQKYRARRFKFWCAISIFVIIVLFIIGTFLAIFVFPKQWANLRYIYNVQQMQAYVAKIMSFNEEITTESLQEHNKAIENAIQQIQDWDIQHLKITEQQLREFQSNKIPLVVQLKNKQKENLEEYNQLHALEENIELFSSTYLIETIQQRKEYVTIAQHVQELLSMVSKYPYYQEKYAKKLTIIQLAIRNYQQNDRYEYQQIRKAYIAQEYKTAVQLIHSYNSTKQHPHIMTEKLKDCQDRIQCTFSISCQVMDNSFEDEEKPDFTFTVGIYAKIDNKMMLISSEFSNTLNNVIKKIPFTVFQSISCKLYLFHENILTITAQENDMFTSDKYAPLDIPLDNCLNNQSITVLMSCYSQTKFDGTLQIMITPIELEKTQIPEWPTID